MAGQGYVFTKDVAKQQLKNMNRTYEGRKTWNEYYGAVDIAGQSAINQATRNYESDILAAYKTAQQNANQITDSSLGEGFKQDLLADIDTSLMEAYQAYQNNYATNIQNIESTIDAQKANIDAALDVQAENTAKISETGYDYLLDLYNRAYGLDTYENVGGDDKLAKLFENDTQWNKYIVADGDSSKLIDKYELYNSLFDTDENGNKYLNVKGTDFYDQMINQLGTQLGYEYGYYEWLSKNDEDLYKWSQEVNPFDFTNAGTNMGTFKTMLGMESTDHKYEFIERFGGMSSEEIDAKFKEFEESVKFTGFNAEDINKGKNIDAITESVDNAFANITKWAEDLGIYDELDKEISAYDENGNVVTGWDNVQKVIKRNYEYMYNKDEISREVGKAVTADYAKNVSAVALTGASIGAIGGPAAPVTVTLGALIGAAVGAVGSTLSLNKTVNTARTEHQQSNAQYVDTLKTDYLNLLEAMSNYAKQKAKSTQNNNYNYN